jgi:hypothetical protein
LRERIKQQLVTFLAQKGVPMGHVQVEIVTTVIDAVDTVFTITPLIP